MGKDLRISMLFDFYGELLTEKQADSIELYYNQDLSLGEISQHLDITRQGVRDSIKRGEKLLLEMEEKLKLAKKFHRITSELSNIEVYLKDIETINNGKFFSPEITKDLINMKHIVKKINDII